VGEWLIRRGGCETAGLLIFLIFIIKKRNLSADENQIDITVRWVSG
jgi:hypothetical protein